MARGWESKSVEEQQNQFQRSETKPRKSADDLRRDETIQSLKLKRARVLEQMKQSQSSRYIELLQRELDDLDGELHSLST
jgi:hypothetical protein